jgi:hypothetical protein
MLFGVAFFGVILARKPIGNLPMGLLIAFPFETSEVTWTSPAIVVSPMLLFVNVGAALRNGRRNPSKILSASVGLTRYKTARLDWSQSAE